MLSRCLLGSFAFSIISASSSYRHFLFKTPSGSTPLFSSSSPGYPLTGGSVYSPPPRLLPRNTFSRSSFKLKKPSKYCSWKCAAMSAIAAAVLLAVLLSYFIGKLVLFLVFLCCRLFFFLKSLFTISAITAPSGQKWELQNKL